MPRRVNPIAPGHEGRAVSMLDPGRLNAVRSLVYDHFPMKQGENEDQDWRK